MSNGITAQDVIDLGEFGGVMGAPRGTAGGRGIIRVGGFRPVGGRAPPGRRPVTQTARQRAGAAARKLRPTKKGVKRGTVVGGALGVVAAGAAVLGGEGVPSATKPPTLRELARAFRPSGREREATARLRAGRPKGVTARRIRETSAAVKTLARQKGISEKKAARVLRATARLRLSRAR